MNLPSSSSLTSRIRRNTNSSNEPQSNHNYVNERQTGFIIYDIFSLLIWVCIGVTAAWVLVRLLLIRCGRRLRRNWIDVGIPSHLHQFISSFIVFLASLFFFIVIGLCLPSFFNEISPSNSSIPLSCSQILASMNLLTVSVLGMITYFINSDHLPINHEPPLQNPAPEAEEVEELV